MLLVKHGMAPEQHGLVSPGITGFNENRATYQRLEERADREIHSSQEPAPAEIYPETEGRFTKEESLQTQYDVLAALDRL